MLKAKWAKGDMKLIRKLIFYLFIYLFMYFFFLFFFFNFQNDQIIKIGEQLRLGCRLVFQA